MLAMIAETLGTPASGLSDDDELLYLGLDSIQVMRLASRWRRAGIDVTYAELIERPTVGQWRELLAGKVSAGTGLTAGPPQSQADGPGVPFELAPMQFAYWVGRDERRPLGGVGAQFYCEFDGAGVRADRLGQAARALIARHDMLRACFLDDGRQLVLPESTWPGVTVHDLRDLDEAEAQERAERLRATMSQRRMAAERGEGFDGALCIFPCGRTREDTERDVEDLALYLPWRANQGPTGDRDAGRRRAELQGPAV